MPTTSIRQGRAGPDGVKRLRCIAAPESIGKEEIDAQELLRSGFHFSLAVCEGAVESEPQLNHTGF